MSESLPLEGAGAAGAPPPRPLDSVAWLICIIAAIGFAFDIYELLMLPLIFRPAFIELSGMAPNAPGFTDEFSKWLGRLFYIPAFAGGIVGMLGGYLTDRLGRRRVLTWSILVYALSAFLAGFSTNLWMLLILRCTCFIGVCVEFVAAVAWLAELFPNPKQREKVLGTTQAFSSIGGLLVAVAAGLAADWSNSLPGIKVPSFLGEVRNPHAAWRYTLMSGLIPAIPLILIRPFLPESPAWQKKKAAGTLKRPSFAALFQPAFRRTTIVTALMFACSYGAAFGAIQMMPQIVPGLPEVRAKIAEQTKVNVEAEVKKQLAANPSANREQVVKAVSERIARQTAGEVGFKEASNVTKIQEVGGLMGRVLLAVLAVYIVGRRALLRIFQVPGLFIMPVVFGWAAVTGWWPLAIGLFFAGMVTVGQFSFWGNYLPRVYPVHLRGTGESFAANIGGRLIGTSFAWVTATIAGASFWNPSYTTAARYAYTAAIVGTFVYLSGLILSFFLPEPGHRDIDESDHAPPSPQGVEAAAAVGVPTQVVAHGPKP
jgi:MFS family permease